MRKLKKWFHLITFGEEKQYLKFIGWMLLDSIVASVPFTVLMMVIWVLLNPVMNVGATYDSRMLWILTAVLAVQTVIYIFIRRKTYMDICVGHSEALKSARLRMGGHLKQLSMGFFSNHDAGKLSTILVQDYDEVEQTSSMIVANISVITIRLLLGIIMVMAFQWKMGLAMFAVIPLAVPFAVISYRRVRKSGAELIETREKTSSLILEFVGGINTLKAYNQAGDKFDKLKRTLAQFRDVSKMQERAGGPVSMIGRGILFMGIGVVMAVGAKLFVSGEISAFFYIMCLLAALVLYEPLIQMLVLIVTLGRTNRAAERINRLYEETVLPVTADKMTDYATIELKNVSFGYHEGEPVLSDINLTFPQNTLTALVGPSGSGKSTVTRLGARFWDVSEGEITVGGVGLNEMTQETLLSKLSMVFQDVYLFHDTVEENIRTGRAGASHEEIVAAAKMAACHDFIMQLPDGYNTVVGEGRSTLSGGEKQRISIARAILKDAPIVLLDEATASLDPENEVLIQKAISSLVQNKTVIVIAHRLQSVKNADNIVVLNHGRVEEQGTHEELLQSDGLYQALWTEQDKAAGWKIAK